MQPNLVRYKVQREGGLFHQIGRFEKSTGICSECGQRHTLSLTDREFQCRNCGAHQNRDHSSAIAIERIGERELSAAGTVVRVSPKAQQKAGIKTKVFERVSKLPVGAEQKDAA